MYLKKLLKKNGLDEKNKGAGYMDLINEIMERLSNKYKVIDSEKDTIIVKERSTEDYFCIKVEKVSE